MLKTMAPQTSSMSTKVETRELSNHCREDFTGADTGDSPSPPGPHATTRYRYSTPFSRSLFRTAVCPTPAVATCSQAPSDVERRMR